MFRRFHLAFCLCTHVIKYPGILPGTKRCA
jgi:hypothetical protein